VKRIPNPFQAVYIVDRLKLTTDRFCKWLPKHLVGAVVLEELYHLLIPRDLGFIEVPVAKFLSDLSIHKRLVPLDEVQGLSVLLQTAFLATEIGGGWMKQVTC
jgi:hypothetical protein